GDEFQNLYFRGGAQGPPYFLELARQQTSEDSVHVAGVIKAARLPELLGVARVVTQLGMVQAQLHVTRKRDRPVLTNFLFDDVAQAHKPVRCRSARSWGVRMNISTM